MRVLAVNSGSSSLKVALLEVDGNAPREVLRGAVERIGEAGRLTVHTAGGDVKQNIAAPDHRAAFLLLKEHLTGRVDAVGHRVVHGGPRFSRPTLLEGAAVDEIERLSVLAPLHNPAAVAGIRAAAKAFGSAVPQVAVFDTGFYHSLPAAARFYALPYDLSQRHGIRRYGFHGIAHEYAMRRYCALTRREATAVKLVSFQLGAGCSATAVDRGQAVETSMGFTPLEGLVMGTRSGDLDPGVIAYLWSHAGIGAAGIEGLLNERSGLLGVSGLSADLRDLLAAAQQGHERATLALTLFVHRARKYLGAYLGVLGGAEAVLFSGGIGEHAPWARAEICRGMEWCGLALDEGLNAGTTGAEGRISRDGAPIAAYVIPTNEELLIAEQTARLLQGTR